jgi:hypothetical protein
MAEEKPKEQLEKEKAEKELKETRISNLKTLSLYEGARYLKSNESPYGSAGMEAGSHAYSTFLMSDQAKKIRDDAYKSKLEQAANSGTIAQPEYTNNYELEQNSLGLLKDAKSGLNLGDLEKIVNELSPGYLTFKIPKELKDKNYGAIEKKIQEESMKIQEKIIEIQKQLNNKQIDEDTAKEKVKELQETKYQPTKEEKQIVQIMDTLEFAYTDGAANKLQREYKMAKFNEMGKEIENSYKPKEEKKAE